jgi:hypothetical protein
MLAPICLFTYNRPYETKLTIEALKLNFLASSSELYIFSDGPKNNESFEKVRDVRNYIKNIDGFKIIKIIESTVNKGLANSIIEGVTQIINQYEKVIVMEDDLVTQPNFLKFMNHALDFYEQEKKIQSVNGYSVLLKSPVKEIYFQTRPFPWGWGTWKDRWTEDIFDKQRLKLLIQSDRILLKQFKRKCGNDISKMLIDSINSKNDSWYVRWTFDHFMRKNYSLFPYKAYIENIGHNIESTHCKGINTYISEMNEDTEYIHELSDFYVPDKNSVKEFLEYFTISHKMKFRIKLLGSKLGRKKIIEELKYKIGVI